MPSRFRCPTCKKTTDFDYIGIQRKEFLYTCSGCNGTFSIQTLMPSDRPLKKYQVRVDDEKTE